MPATDVPDFRPALGQRVRALRTERGLSTRALAAVVGVTSGFISQIENGQVTPSLATLFRLTAELGVSMGELFDAVPHPANGRLLRASERTVLEPIAGVRDQVLSLDPTRQIEVTLLEIDPGAATGEEPSTHGAQAEFVLVLEGALEVLLGETTYELDVGDALTFSGDVPHRYVNRTDAVTRAIWASTPASF